MTAAITPVASWDDVHAPEASDPVNTATQAACWQRVANRLASLVDVQVFPGASAETEYTWTKPADAIWIEFFVVGPGSPGGAGDSTGGGGGGSSGEMVHCIVPASQVPDSLYLDVTSPDGSTKVYRSGTGFYDTDFLIYALNGTGGADGASGGAGGTGRPADQSLCLGGGYYASGAAGDGTRGAVDAQAGYGGNGGQNGNDGGAGGKGGYGWGAGGGGGGGVSTYNGGGGGGGYGTVKLAEDGADDGGSGGIGGAGAPGVVIITTYRGIAP